MVTLHPHESTTVAATPVCICLMPQRMNRLWWDGCPCFGANHHTQAVLLPRLHHDLETPPSPIQNLTLSSWGFRAMCESNFTPFRYRLEDGGRTIHATSLNGENGCQTFTECLLCCRAFTSRAPQLALLEMASDYTEIVAPPLFRWTHCRGPTHGTMVVS